MITYLIPTRTPQCSRLVLTYILRLLVVHKYLVLKEMLNHWWSLNNVYTYLLFSIFKQSLKISKLICFWYFLFLTFTNSFELGLLWTVLNGFVINRDKSDLSIWVYQLDQGESKLKHSIIIYSMIFKFWFKMVWFFLAWKSKTTVLAGLLQ